MKASPRHEVREMYESTADSYAEMMDSEIEQPVYTDGLARLAQRIRGLSGSVVDTSCGSGHMLRRYREAFDPERELIGIDLSPRMVSIATARAGGGTRFQLGDMRKLEGIDSGSAAAVVSYFAIHHLSPDEVSPALAEWQRILCPGGQLLAAMWEGEGVIDYGEASEVVAFRYPKGKVIRWAELAGFVVDRCVVEPVEGFAMDAMYLEGSRAGRGGF